MKKMVQQACGFVPCSMWTITSHIKIRGKIVRTEAAETESRNKKLKTMQSKVWYGPDTVATIVKFLVVEKNEDLLSDWDLVGVGDENVEDSALPNVTPYYTQLALVDLVPVEDVTIQSPTTGRPSTVARRLQTLSARRSAVRAGDLGNLVMTMQIGSRVHVLSTDFSFHPVYGGPSDSGKAPRAEVPKFHSFQF